MASTSLLDCALAALKSNNKALLRQIYDDLSAKIGALQTLSRGEHFPEIGKTFRDIGAETAYLPGYVKADKTKPSVALR